jgi:hypothetical protein
MRQDAADFRVYNEARVKSPLFVVRIVFDVDSLAITSDDVTGVVAGTVLQGLLADPTVTSQKLKPDDAVAEIGSASFSLVDIAGQFTDEIRERQLDGEGLRGKTVQFYVGYVGLDFSDFQLVATQVVSNVAYSEGRYEISCLDIQRALRTQIFEPVATTLSTSITATDVTITLTSTTGLQMVQHDAGWSDAPTQIVGYVKIKSEIIRYTGIAGNQLTGCTRGAFNTIAAAYTVDPAAPAERREKVTEYIYLEMASVRLAYALLTGMIHGNLLGTLGGMEADTNADGLSDGWGNYVNTTTYSRVTGHSGSFAQRFQGTGSASPRLTTSTGILIASGTKFTISAWFNAVAAQQLLLSAKGFSSPGGSELVTYGQTVVAAVGGWQRLSLSLVGDGKYVKIQVGIAGAFAAGVGIIVDDVQLQYGDLLTDYVDVQAALLPASWNIGISPDLVKFSGFIGIGSDIWIPADPAGGFPLRFEGLTKTDGKRFLEKEVYLPTGLYSPVGADGRLGLRRMIRLREDAAAVLTLDESNVISVSDLEHDMRSLHNAFVVNWSWNGTEFRRSTGYLDQSSIAKHKESETLTLNFKGLHGAKHTDGIIYSMLGMIRDRYAGPPHRLSVVVMPSLNRIEVGDVVRLRIANVRDFSAGADRTTTSLDRAYEVQNVSVDYRGGVSLDLFGSTSDPAIQSVTAGSLTSLPDAFYAASGTALSAVTGVVIGSNIMTAAPAGAITGNASLTASGAVYYHLGDLTVAAGVDLKIAANVQLRIRGFLTVNGSINGVGRGIAGVVDDGRALNVTLGDLIFVGQVDETIPGSPGYVGTTRGFDGTLGVRPFAVSADRLYNTREAAAAVSKYAVAPRLLLSVSGTALKGLPDDIRGGGGPPGGRIQSFVESTLALTAITSFGGSGGAGGAGLAIICRGMGFGVNGYIDLSGADTTAPVLITSGAYSGRAGNGGPGGPGTLYLLLDGGSLSVPDVAAGKFRAKVGTATLSANPLPLPHANYFNDVVNGTTQGVVMPITGWRSPEFTSINGLDMSGAALVIQHIPAAETATADSNSPVSPPTALTTESAEQGINVTITFPEDVEAVELYMSSTNDRTNATRVFDGLATVIRVRVPDGALRYFWARTRLAGVRSTWYPVSSVAGVAGTSVGGLICRGQCEAFNNGVIKNGGSAAWDSDAYSAESFASGIYVSFQASQTNAAIMVGLNSDPDTDQSFTSLDYAFYCRSDGGLTIYESGVSQGTFGSYTTTTTLSIKYDGQQVVYLKDGVIQRVMQVVGLTLFIDSSFNTPGGAIKNLRYGALTAVTLAPWIARNRCVCTLNTISKSPGSTAAFDSDCYSQTIYENGCMLTFQAAQTNCQLMIGLNSDPTTDQNFTSLDYCWHISAAGISECYESGVAAGGTSAAYTTSTVFGIKYDGQQVIYLRDGVTVRTVQVRGGLFFMDSSFLTPGGMVKNVDFGPLTTAPSIPFVTVGGCVATLNTIRKVSGAAATQDAGAYSTQAFDACSASAQCNLASTGIANGYFGLNTDPLTDTLETSIDYGFKFGGSNLSALVNGVASTIQVGYAVTDICLIKYDGETVRWYVNAVEVKALADPGKKFFFDCGLNNVGTMLFNVEFKALTNSPAVPFTVTGTVIAGASTIKKVGGSGAWDSQAYSVQAFESGCYLSFQTPNVTSHGMLGLNTDPTTDADYTSLDYAIYIQNTGTYYFYESGVSAGSAVAYTAGTNFGIRYDGQQIQYLVNGAVVRTVQNVIGKTFYFDSSILAVGSEFKNVSFRPLTTAPTIPWITRGTAVATATTARKIGGSGAWDADASSSQAYRGGCVLAFNPEPAGNSPSYSMVGLDDNPAASVDQTTLEHAWYVHSASGLQIYESNVMVLDLGSSGQWTTATALAIVYDGMTVRYLRNGTLIREVYSPGKTFYGRVALHSPGQAVRGLYFGALSQATPVPFIARQTTVVVSGTSAMKASGGAAWDADVISIVGYPKAYLQFKASQVNGQIMAGLNSDPYTDASYTSIDAAFYMDAAGGLSIYESGSSVQAVGSYTTATLLGITYDGANFRYYKDAVLVRTTAAVLSNVFFDSSFNSVGHGINSINFGAGTVFPLIDTPDIGAYATTDPIGQTSSATVSSTVATTSSTATDLLSLSFTPTVNGEAKLTVACEGRENSTHGGTSYTTVELYEATFYGLLDDKRIAYITSDNTFTYPGNYAAYTMTAKIAVTAGTTYTAKLRIKAHPESITKAAPGVDVTSKWLRVEVNKR